MGFFSKVGRQVEEFRQTAKSVAESEADYRCTACESWFHTDHDRCPDCDAAAVERVADGK